MKAWGNKAKQYALNLTDIEIKVEQATNNDPWGPHGTVMGGRLLVCCLHPTEASLLLICVHLAPNHAQGLIILQKLQRPHTI